MAAAHCSLRMQNRNRELRQQFECLPPVVSLGFAFSRITDSLGYGPCCFFRITVGGLGSLDIDIIHPCCFCFRQQMWNFDPNYYIFKNWDGPAEPDQPHSGASSSDQFLVLKCKCVGWPHIALSRITLWDFLRIICANCVVSCLCSLSSVLYQTHAGPTLLLLVVAKLVHHPHHRLPWSGKAAWCG